MSELFSAYISVTDGIDEARIPELLAEAAEFAGAEPCSEWTYEVKTAEKLGDFAHITPREGVEHRVYSCQANRRNLTRPAVD